MTTNLAGLALAALLGALVLLGLVVTWRRPFLGLAVLVTGMAAHNVAIMALIRLHTPAPLIRGVQAWKEVVLALLVLIVIIQIRKRWNEGWRPRLIALDWIMVAFSALIVGYATLQLALAAGDATLAQRLISVRLSLLPPLLYALGRWCLPRTERHLQATGLAIVGSAAIVGVVGLWELWFVPTVQWLDWGAVGFSEWLGYRYRGPAGLPPNFFQGLADGLLLRRMVSTYISPLGIAYTGLLVIPLAAGVAYARETYVPRWLGWVLLSLVTTAVLFSVTRLALLCMAAEFVFLAFLFRGRRAIIGSVVALVAVAAVLYGYPKIGPLLTYDLTEYSSPTAFLRSGTASSLDPGDREGGELIEEALSAQDDSVRGHVRALVAGVAYMVEHPLGTGPGSAVPRYGETDGPGESALLRIGGEVGLPGALLYLAMYAGALFVAWRAFVLASAGWLRSFSLVALVGGLALIPIMLTSDVWGNFSVTFLLWWCVGLCASVSARVIDPGLLAPETADRPRPLPPSTRGEEGPAR